MYDAFLIPSILVWCRAYLAHMHGTQVQGEAWTLYLTMIQGQLL